MLFRIAPTPSGFLHLGNAVNFVLTWLAARGRGAPLLLRIDDLDADRKRPEYVDDVFRTLDFLGLDYDLGPASPDDFEAHWSQRHRIGRYVDTLEGLRASGTLYACGLSRRALQARGVTYPAEGRAQQRSLDEPDVAWRFRAEGDGSADFVVRRRDGLPAYQIASLTDDHEFGVTYLIRGRDLQESSDRQRQLASALGWSDFLDAQVWHHPVLMGENGQKLSKSVGDGTVANTSIRAMRDRGTGPDLVYGQVARLLNAPPEAAHRLTDLLAWGVSDNLFSPVESVKLS
ncbi:glutamate--tRNA ligase family protein [uncultured Fibrella sp.]|uniref:glutamate--tRNA ligase family protein n=1 Tax=uncultured Fibrella sp. TaxID=1284596 RepID=UPI0035CA9AED